MAIPDYQAFMLPLLKFAADGEVYPFREVVEALAGEFELTNDEREELLPSGRQPVVENRIGWAKTYLKKAAVLERILEENCANTTSINHEGEGLVDNRLMGGSIR